MHVHQRCTQARCARARGNERHVQERAAWHREYGSNHSIVHTHMCRVSIELVCHTQHTHHEMQLHANAHACVCTVMCMHGRV